MNRTEKFLYLLLRSTNYSFKHFNRPFRTLLARTLGRIAGRFPTESLKAVTRNLGLVVPAGEGISRRIRSKVFENFAESLHDFLFPGEIRMEIPDVKKIEFLERHRGGIVLLTFHAGAWELGSHVLSRLRRKTAAVYQPYRYPALRDWIHSHRADGLRYFRVGHGAARESLRALRKGWIVAMVGDRPYGEDGIPVQFCGQTISWAKGPLRMAQKTDSIVIPSFVRRVRSGHYRAEFGEPLDVRTLESAAQTCADIYSEFVRRYPEQWARFDSLIPSRAKPVRIFPAPQKEVQSSASVGPARRFFVRKRRSKTAG